MNCATFPHSVGCFILLYFVDGFPCIEFLVVPLAHFCFCCPLLLVSNPKSPPRDWCRGAHPLITSGNFIVSGITFKFSRHPDWTFVYGVRQASSFILSYVAVRFSPHNLLNRLPAPYLCLKLIIWMQLYLWALCCTTSISVLCQYHTLLIIIAL